MMRLEILFSRILGTRVGILTPRNKKSFVSITILMMAMVLVATPAFATHFLYVSKTGSNPGVMDNPSQPWLTIQAAIDAIPSSLGEPYIVQVQDSGTYNEQVTVSGKTTSVTNTITIPAQSGQTPTISWSVNSQYVIKIDGVDYVTLEGLKITSNSSYNQIGVWVYSSDYFILQNNEIDQNGKNDTKGIRVQISNDGKITKNIIHHNYIGAEIYYINPGSNNNTIHNNLLYDNTAEGIQFHNSGGHSIFNNTIYQSGGKGIAINPDAKSNSVIKNNIIYMVSSGYCVWVSSDGFGTGTVVNYNDYYPTGTAIVGQFAGTDYSTLSDWQGGTSQDVNSISADPLFITAGSDFHLGDYSQCIGAGATSGAPTDDIEGNARGNPPDIGAYENSRDTPLPVELSVFTAQYLNNVPTLYWQTQSETNNAGWNIYRGETNEALSNEETYLLNLSLGLIPGAGTTSEPTEYSFEDFFPISQGNTYFYWLESVDYSGESEIYGPISLTIPENEWQNPNSPEIPKPYGLHQNYPNPFNPNTEISFMMKENSIGELSIYNVKGQKIKTIFSNSSIPKDELQIYIWNGKDESGKEVSTGVYLYELKTNREIYLKRMLLIK